MFLNYKIPSVYSKLSRKGWDERRKVESDSGKKKKKEEEMRKSRGWPEKEQTVPMATICSSHVFWDEGHL